MFNIVAIECETSIIAIFQLLEHFYNKRRICLKSGLIFGDYLFVVANLFTLNIVQQYGEETIHAILFFKRSNNTIYLFMFFHPTRNSTKITPWSFRNIDAITLPVDCCFFPLFDLAVAGFLTILSFRGTHFAEFSHTQIFLNDVFDITFDICRVSNILINRTSKTFCNFFYVFECNSFRTSTGFAVFRAHILSLAQSECNTHLTNFWYH